MTASIPLSVSLNGSYQASSLRRLAFRSMSSPGVISIRQLSSLKVRESVRGTPDSISCRPGIQILVGDTIDHVDGPSAENDVAILQSNGPRKIVTVDNMQAWKAYSHGVCNNPTMVSFRLASPARARSIASNPCLNARIVIFALITERGVDEIALAMRDAAQEAGVPVVRNIRLARQLLWETNNGDPVPRKLFDIVAEIILWAQKSTQSARHNPEFKTLVALCPTCLPTTARERLIVEVYKRQESYWE